MSSKISKNKIKTPSYFIKRLRDNGFITIRLFDRYAKEDPRRWTILVDPSGASVFITCYQNKDFLNDIMFELNDGGQRFNKNYSLKTESIEVIIKYLIAKGVSNNSKNSPYYQEKRKYISEPTQQASG
jgi:hypothetical protein